jgi:outer membrane receptor protein involved in Fe transport
VDATPPGGCIQLSPLVELSPGDPGNRVPPTYDENSYQPNHVFYDRQKEHNTSWRVGFDYKPSDSVLLYVNVAKGYKAGGYPQVTTSTDAQFEPVKQESVIDYEGGFKTQLFNRTLSLSGAAFYYNYRNKQLRGKIIDPIFGALDKLLNIPKASLKGAELSIAWIPFSGLTASASGTYVDGKIKKFIGVNGSGVTADFAGTPMPLSPKWQFATALDYEFPVSEDAKLFLGANTTYNSKTYGVIGGGLAVPGDPDPANMIKSFFLLDLRAGVKLDDDRLSLSVWGKNVTNSYYWYNAVQIYDQKVRYTGRPATYGMTLSYRY